MRICCVKAGINNHCFIKPYKRRLICSETCLFAKSGKLVLFFFFRKLAGNSVKHCIDFILIPFRKLSNIITVEF